MIKEKELILITKTKKLSELIFKITQTSPKRYRFSLVSKLQNIALDIVSEMYMANDTIVNIRLIEDMDKTISYIKKKDERELTDWEIQKLFELQIEREKKYNERTAKRMEHSLKALTNLRELDWLVVLAKEMGCITSAQMISTAKEIFEVRKLLSGYIQSDRKRYKY